MTFSVAEPFFPIFGLGEDFELGEEGLEEEGVFRRVLNAWMFLAISSDERGLPVAGSVVGTRSSRSSTLGFSVEEDLGSSLLLFGPDFFPPF